MQNRAYLELVTQSRSVLIKLSIISASIFGFLWLFLEPLNLFGVADQWFKNLGIVGYLLLALLSVSVGSVVTLIRHHLLLRNALKEMTSEKLQLSINDPILSQNTTRDLTSEVCAFVRQTDNEPLFLEDLVNRKEHSFTVHEKLHIITVVTLFRDLGLLQIRRQNEILVESERALGLIRIIGLSVKHSTPFLGDWKAKGSKNPDSVRLNRLLQDIEHYRIDKQGGLYNAPATRSVKSALIIIKGRYKDIDRYLMQRSTAWNEDGYFWFIGGVMAPSDKTIEECARRELAEELDIKDSMIGIIKPICTTNDKRISSRVGLFTEYEYTLFSITLDVTQSAVQRLLQLDFELEQHVAWLPYKRINRWLTWEEITNSEGIRRNANAIVERLENLGTDSITLSVPILFENNIKITGD